MESQSKSSWMSSAGMRRIGKFPEGIMCCWFICAWWPREHTHPHKPCYIQYTSYILHYTLAYTCAKCILALLNAVRILLRLKDCEDNEEPLTCHGVACIVYGRHVGITWRTHHRGHALSRVHVHSSWKIIIDIHPLTKKTKKNVLHYGDNFSWDSQFESWKIWLVIKKILHLDYLKILNS